MSDATTSEFVSEWPTPDDVNWELLKELSVKPHPLLRMVDWSDCHWSATELLSQAARRVSLTRVPRPASRASPSTTGGNDNV